MKREYGYYKYGVIKDGIDVYYVKYIIRCYWDFKRRVSGGIKKKLNDLFFFVR